MKLTNKTYTATGLLLLLIVGWMASGVLVSDSDADGAGDNDAQPGAADSSALMKVEVTEVLPKTMERNITLQGQLHARRQLAVKAETGGSIELLPLEKGDRVSADTLIARLSIDGRDALLKEAEARISTAASEQAATNKLQQQGLQSQLKAEQAKATLASARAALERIELEISQTEIRTPFAGIVNQVHVELGQQIDKGTVIATLVDNSSFRVTASVAQQSVHKLSIGQAINIQLITGTRLQGELSYISAIADPATRSFAVEAKVENDGQQIAAGTSASMHIPVETIKAFFISPSTIALSDNGDIGIKAVNQDNRVEFHPVTLVQTSSSGAWVTGVPSGTRVITLGQGFVNEGQEVEPVEAAGDKSAETAS